MFSLGLKFQFNAKAPKKKSYLSKTDKKNFPIAFSILSQKLLFFFMTFLKQIVFYLIIWGAKKKCFEWRKIDLRQIYIKIPIAVRLLKLRQDRRTTTIGDAYKGRNLRPPRGGWRKIVETLFHHSHQTLFRMLLITLSVFFFLLSSFQPWIRFNCGAAYIMEISAIFFRPALTIFNCSSIFRIHFALKN